MMWRAADSIGVEFLEQGVASENAQATIQRLEVENRKLRNSVALLSKRLEDLGQAVSFV